jgi:hypothetical protein
MNKFKNVGAIELSIGSVLNPIELTLYLSKKIYCPYVIPKKYWYFRDNNSNEEPYLRNSIAGEKYAPNSLL